MALALMAACSASGDDDDSTATTATTTTATTTAKVGGPITVAIDGADEIALGEPLLLTMTLTNSGERSVAAPIENGKVMELPKP